MGELSIKSGSWPKFHQLGKLHFCHPESAPVGTVATLHHRAKARHVRSNMPLANDKSWLSDVLGVCY